MPFSMSGYFCVRFAAEPGPVFQSSGDFEERIEVLLHVPLSKSKEMDDFLQFEAQRQREAPRYCRMFRSTMVTNSNACCERGRHNSSYKAPIILTALFL